MNILQLLWNSFTFTGASRHTRELQSMRPAHSLVHGVEAGMREYGTGVSSSWRAVQLCLRVLDLWLPYTLAPELFDYYVTGARGRWKRTSATVKEKRQVTEMKFEKTVCVSPLCSKHDELWGSVNKQTCKQLYKLNIVIEFFCPPFSQILTAHKSLKITFSELEQQMNKAKLLFYQNQHAVACSDSDVLSSPHLKLVLYKIYLVSFEIQSGLLIMKG